MPVLVLAGFLLITLAGIGITVGSYRLSGTMLAAGGLILAIAQAGYWGD